MITGDTMTVVWTPHTLAAQIYEQLGIPTAVLAPPVPEICTQAWGFLVRPAQIPAPALAALARVGVRVLAPGTRVALPTTPAPGHRWWLQWPQPSVITNAGHTMGAPDMPNFLNRCFAAAHTGHLLTRGEPGQGRPVVFEPRARSTVTP